MAWLMALIGAIIALADGSADAVARCYTLAAFWMAAAVYYRLGEPKP